jgi:hypothetical protein
MEGCLYFLVINKNEKLITISKKFRGLEEGDSDAGSGENFFSQWVFVLSGSVQVKINIYI